MRVLQGILLSVMIHFLFAWSAKYAPVLANKMESKDVTVEIIDHTKSQNETDKEKQVVRQTEVPENLKTQESDDPLSFLSERSQRVKKQTRAEMSGMTKNRSNQELTPEEQAAKNFARPTEPQRNQSSADDDGISPRPKKRDPRKPGSLEAFTPKYKTVPNLPRPEDLEKGMSTIGEALPEDVAVGSFTALNTDRFAMRLIALRRNAFCKMFQGFGQLTLKFGCYETANFIRPT